MTVTQADPRTSDGAAEPAKVLAARRREQGRPPRRRLDGIADLLERRADLRGAYPPADYLAEAVRWNA